jgi:hypothetical protein
MGQQAGSSSNALRLNALSVALSQTTSTKPQTDLLPPAAFNKSNTEGSIPMLSMFAKTPASIRASLAETQAEIAAFEQTLPQIALAALEAGDNAPAHEAIAKLGQLKARLQVLELSMSAAEKVELAKQAEQKAREHKARQRSASQHAAATDRAARQVSIACEALIAAWAELAKCASSLEASLGMTVADEAGFPLLRVNALRREVQAALYRHDAKARPTLFDRPTGTFDYEHVKETLEGQVGKLTQRAKASFETSVDMLPSVAPAPAPMDEPAAEVPVGPCAPAAGIVPAPEPEGNVYGINLSHSPTDWVRPSTSEGVNG